MTRAPSVALPITLGLCSSSPCTAAKKGDSEPGADGVSVTSTNDARRSVMSSSSATDSEGQFNLHLAARIWTRQPGGPGRRKVTTNQPTNQQTKNQSHADYSRGNEDGNNRPGYRITCLSLSSVFCPPISLSLLPPSRPLLLPMAVSLPPPSYVSLLPLPVSTSAGVSHLSSPVPACLCLFISP